MYHNTDEWEGGQDRISFHPSGLTAHICVTGLLAAFDPNHCAGSRIGLEKPYAVVSRTKGEGFMISRAHYNLAEPESRGYGRAGGYLLIVLIVALLLVALTSNPVLPQ